MKIGLLGGTFDPIHMGHLVIAEEARAKLSLGKVFFIPTGQPWLKTGHSITSAIHRVEMVRRAIAGNPHFELCTIEVERPGFSYTVDTIAALKDSLGEQSLFFILGQDSFVGLNLWKDPDRLVRMCRLVVVPRLGLTLPDVDSMALSIPGLRGSVIELDAPVIGISSSEIRRRVSRSLPVRYLLPEGVGDYIREQGLYKE